MEFNETETAYALYTLQRDRNQGIRLDKARADYYRVQAAQRVMVAHQLQVPADRAGFGHLCAAQMIEAELQAKEAA